MDGSLGGSVATTRLEAGPASQTSRFCDSANRTDPGKSRGSNGRRQSIDLTRVATQVD